jgi:hypothetical protein
LLSGAGQNQGIGLSGGQKEFVPVLADAGAGCAGIRTNIAAQMQSRTAKPTVLFVNMSILSVRSFRATEASSVRSRSHQRAEIIFIQIKELHQAKSSSAALLNSQKGI